MGKEIGEAWIQFSAKGFEQLQTKMNGLEKKLESTKGKATSFGAALKDMADQGASAFGRLQNSVFGFVSVASPATMDRLNGSLGQLAVQIGRILVPIVQRLTAYVQSLTQWFRNLSDGSREQILFYVQLAGGILLACVAIQKFNQATSLISANPWILVGVAVALLIAKMKELKDQSEAMANQTISKGEGNISTQEHNFFKDQTDKQLDERIDELNKRQAEIQDKKAKRWDVKFPTPAGWVGLREAGNMYGSREEDNAYDLNQKSIQAMRGEKAFRSGKGKLDSAEGKEDGSKFGVELRHSAPQLMGVAEAWKRAQTAQQNQTPELMILQEILGVQKEQLKRTPTDPITKKDVGAKQ